MKRAHTWLAAALLTLAATAVASAQGPYQPPYYYPGYKPYPCYPPYDVCCGPVSYTVDAMGNVYPAHQVRPPFQPFNGLLPVQDNGGGGGGRAGFGLPQHPYARSPRDFFMYYDR